MGDSKELKPGSVAPASAQYIRVGPRGGEGIEVTGVKGKRLPPAPGPDYTYKISDRTKNKSGKGN